MAAISPQACVCQDAEVVGSVTVGPKTVIHPRARLIAQNGPIEIGAGNIIEETVTIINTKTEPLIIGDSNRIACGAYIDSVNIGNDNIIEERARLHFGAKVGDGCVMTAGLSLNKPLPNETVLFDITGKTQPINESVLNASKTLHKQHIDCLLDVLPRFNYIVGRSVTAPVKTEASP